MAWPPGHPLAGLVLAADGYYYPPNEFPPGSLAPAVCAECGGTSGSMVRDAITGRMVHHTSCQIGGSLAHPQAQLPSSTLVGGPRSVLMPVSGPLAQPFGPEFVPNPVETPAS